MILAAQEVELLQVGRDLAADGAWQEWKCGSAFLAVRAKSRGLSATKTRP